VAVCEGERPRVRGVLQRLTEQFRAGHVTEPELSARYLVHHVLGGYGAGSEGQLAPHLDSHLDPAQEQQLAGLVHCRLARMPVQYLLGNWEFHDIRLDLWPPVFIPRPETEQLVKLVLARLALGPRHVLEVGPGSGALCLALLAARPDLTVTAVERSLAAVELTRHNASQLGLEDRLTVIHNRIEKVQLTGSYDAVVSNPPYVLRKDLANLQPEIHVYEDLRALDGGAEGLDVILPILDVAANLICDRGSFFVALEVDPCHAHILPPKLTRFHAEEVIKDFQGKDRFMVMRPVQ